MKTERLELRPLKRADYSAWKNAKSSQGPPQNRFDIAGSVELKNLTRSKYLEILKRHRKNSKADQVYIYGVFLGAQLIGSLSMSVSRGYMHTAMIGYNIFNNHWGKGYGTEALGGLLEIAFKEQKLHRVVAGIEPGNRRSVKLVTKFGFRHEGIAKRALLIRGKWQDLNQYALTCEEYGVIWQG